MKDKTKKRLIFFGTIILVILSIIYFIDMQKYVSTDDAYVETVPVVVAPRVSGQLIKLYVEDNQRVKKNDLVAEIDSADYEAKLAEINALYKAALLKQKNSKAALDATDTELKLAATNLERYTDLYNAGAASKLDYDNAKLAYDTVKAKMTTVEQNLLTENQNTVADANLEILAAQKKQAELALSYTKIYAAQDGTVSNKAIEEGTLVKNGQPMFSIVPDEIWIVANFKENQIRNIQKDQPVSIKVDTYPNKVFQGRIDSIQKISGAKSSMFPPENAVGSFVKIVQRIPVKIVFTEEIDKSKYNIVAGMSVVPKVKVK